MLITTDLLNLTDLRPLILISDSPFIAEGLALVPVLRLLRQRRLAIHLILTHYAVHERMANVMDLCANVLANLVHTCLMLRCLRIKGILQNSLST